MKKFIAYYRVSTKRQGASSLGLEAQKADVLNYIEKHDGEIINAYTEIETGTNKRRRVEIYNALNECKEKDVHLSNDFALFFESSWVEYKKITLNLLIG